MTALSPSLPGQLDSVIKSNLDAERLGPLNLEFMVMVGHALTMNPEADKGREGIHQQAINLTLQWAGQRKADAKLLSMHDVGNPDNYRNTWLRQGDTVRPLIYPACMTSQQAREIYGLEK